MHCTQCSHRLGAVDKFCAGCGHPAAGHKPRQTPRQPFSNPAGAAALAALMAQKEGRIIRRAAVLGVLYLVLPGIAGSMAAADPGADVWHKIGMCYLFGMVPFAVLAIFLMNKSVSEDEYYRLPGSRGGDGEHRCMHCNWRGIYVRGQYGTNLRHHGCSKCKAHFFTTQG